MEAFGEVSEQTQTTNQRNHGTGRPSPPRPPMPYGSDKENHNTISNGSTKVTKKLSNAKDKPAAPVRGPADGANIQLARAGETVLETFYGLLYIYNSEMKDWKLAADGYIPLCFIQERGNANKPFKVIAAHGSIRLMEFPVTKDTKCTQNKAFIRWHDSSTNMYGVRFHREEQANQFFSAMDRMKSTLAKTAELFKQPERKTMVSHISDPTVEGVSHTKISLIVKLPNKETTIMTVPGLISIGELFELICKRESLDPKEHQLNLPKVGGKELNCDPETVLGSLKIREVSVGYVGGASTTSSTSTVDEDMSLKNKQAPVSTALTRTQSNNVSTHVPLSMEKTTSLSQSSEQLETLKKEPVKVKRRAPRPPQRPERPKSMPVPRPRTTESPGNGSVTAAPQPKKRQAPARPPAPKIPKDTHLKLITNPDDRSPPEFCPPPPPDDMPPPLDECEHPVSPLSDEDLHETAWNSGDYSSFHITSFKDEPQDIPPPDQEPSTGQSKELASPESIPLKFLLPSPETSTEDGEDVKEREGQSSRISFVGDSRSSSVDISSDVELPTSPTLDYIPPIDLREIDDNENTTEQEPPSVFPPPPPSHFPSETESETLFGNANVESSTTVEQDFEIVAPPPLDFTESKNDELEDTDIESMVVPPPPVMFEDSPDDEITKESSLALESEGEFSIPPPSGFEVDTTESSGIENNELSKKKLGLNTEMFPWVSEPPPAFKAEISETRQNSEPPIDISASEVPLPKMLDVEERTQQQKETQNSEPVDISASEVPLPKMQDVEEQTQQHQVTTSQGEVSSSRRFQTQSQVVSNENDDLVPHGDLLLSSRHEQQQIDEASKSRDIDISSSNNVQHSNDSNASKANQRDVKIIKEKEPNGAVEIPIPRRENSLKVYKEERKSTSSDEGSSSFKTPFDDLGSMENSLSSSVTSEFEDDFPDLKHLKRSANAEKRETFNDVALKKDVENKELSLNTEETVYSSNTETSRVSKTSMSSSPVGSDNITQNNNQPVTKKRMYTEPVIESSNATPIAIPVDILFQSLEQSKTNPENTAVPQNRDPSKSLSQKPLVGGFKLQSWADIKNQERVMEEERQRKIAFDRMQQERQQQQQQQQQEQQQQQMQQQQEQQQQQMQQQQQQKHTPTTSDIKSLPLAHKKSDNELSKSFQADKKPLGFEEKAYAANPNTFSERTPATPDSEGISFTLKTQSKPKQTEPHVVKRHTPLSYVSSALERRSSHGLNSSGDAASSSLERSTHALPSKAPDTATVAGSQNSSAVASSSHAEEKSAVSKQSSVELPSSSAKSAQSFSSSYGAQGVVMRKKTSNQNEDTAQKRKSIQDMMKMFSLEDEEKQKNDEAKEVPRQSPALRLLEERMGYRERSNSEGGAGTTQTATTQSLSATTSDEKMKITKLDTQASDTKDADKRPSETKSLETNVTQPLPVTQSESIKSLPKSRSETVSHETSRSTSTDTDSSRIRPRTNSALTPKPYGVLFPREQKGFTKMTKPSDVTVETKKEIDIPNKASNPKPYDVLFPKDPTPVESSTVLNSGSIQRQNESSLETRNKTEDKSEPIATTAQPVIEIIKHNKNANETQTFKDHGKTKSEINENRLQLTESKPSEQILPSKNKWEPVVTKPQPAIEIMRRNEPSSSGNVVESKTTENEKWTNKNTFEQVESSRNSFVIGQERSTASGDNKEPNNTSQPVELRKKTSVSDPSKRHSMPVGLMTSKPTPAHGSNLKILMAPQISDVDVVPKGRVAAMKAAWKSEDV